MQLYWTDNAKAQFQKMLVYGCAGSGKTPLAATAPMPMLLVSEPGLASLSRIRLPYIEADTYEKARDALRWCRSSNEARQAQTIFFDSISQLSENILNTERKKINDARKYSPETVAKVMDLLMNPEYGLLYIPGKNVVATSKAIEVTKETVVIGGGVQTSTTAECFAAVPKLGSALPYHFDNVLFLSRHTDKATGAEYGALRCRANDYATCRNRSGMLDLWEPADITHIINKANGVTK